MNYDEFMKYLKEGTKTKNVLLLYGEETFLKNHAKETLLKQIKPEQMEEFNLFEFEGKKYDLKAVDDAIEALPVFSDNKVLMFRNSMLFHNTQNQAATKEYKDYWEKRLENIPEEVFVVFDEEKVDKRNKLYKILQSKDACAEFSYLSEQKMLQWTIGLFKTMGKIIHAHDARYLIENVGVGMMSVKHEAEKVCAYTQGEINITRDAIDAVIVPVIENKVFDMVDAILAHNTKTALLKLQDLCSLKEDEARILAAIITSLDRLLTVKIMHDSQMTRVQIIEESKIPPFLVSKYMPLSAKYAKEELELLLTNCIEADRIFKLKRSDRTVMLQRLIIDFTSSKESS